MATIFGFLYMGCTLAQPEEYEWTIHVRRRCGRMSNYFDHLFVPGVHDLWPWHSNSSEQRTKHIFVWIWHKSVQWLLPSIVECESQEPNAFRHIWHITGHQTITANSRVSGPKFTKFLHNVDRTFALLMHPSAFPSCHLLWNASPKNKGVSPISADYAPIIACHGNVPWPIRKPIPDWTSTPTGLTPLKIWWRLVL